MPAPVVPSEFKAAIPDPTSSLCGNFKAALLKLPVLLWKFINWMLDSDGNLSSAFVQMLSNALLPAGTVIESASNTAPTGYLLCNGQAVSRATYSTLFAAIGVTFGTGDGSSTFNVPDCQDRFVIGTSATKLLAGTGGVASVKLVENNIPKIQLGLLATTGTAELWNADAGTGDAVNGPGIGANDVASRAEVLTESFGKADPDAISTVPPYVALHHYIKV